MDPEGLIAKGCTENGGWYSGMKPATLRVPKTLSMGCDVQFSRMAGDRRVGVSVRLIVGLMPHQNPIVRGSPHGW
ncbi:hypothetical protein [Streptomyces sp. NBC_01361]|uniref:hypothetical protein n=1 Tax=Streptomyces sp. NBC_01361 TaxID=2903838 RepID=UPI002E31F01F|nr:hypothetical protein [Streptomyces sp. NBC_01361]